MVVEDSQGLTVVGTPFSTFTRTITLALREKGVEFEQVKSAFPQTPEALAEHPFGRIPSIRHGSFHLIESQAIANYIDVVFDEGPVRIPYTLKLTGPALRPPRSDARASARVDEMASFAASYVFPAVEHGVVKPRLKMQQEGAAEEDIVAKLADGVDALRPVLAEVQERGFRRGPAAPLLRADQPTWADFYLLPPLADLAGIPEGSVLQEFPQLSAWVDAWRKRPSFKATEEGTLLHDSKL